MSCLVCYVFIFRVYLTFVKAVTLILKHATLLRTSKLQTAALTNVDLDYQRANIDGSIQEFLTACPQDLSNEQMAARFAGFIMGTEIGLFIFFHLSPQYLIVILVSSHSSATTDI
jgi:hypothetical protein